MKILAILFLLAGCSTVYYPVDPNEGGTLVQGSRGWKEHSICSNQLDFTQNKGYCVEVVRGPFVLTEVRTSQGCNNILSLAIKDTWGDFPVRWSLQGMAGTPIVYRNNLEILAGESLFVETNGCNETVNGSCYVTWIGHK